MKKQKIKVRKVCQTYRGYAGIVWMLAMLAASGMPVYAAGLTVTEDSIKTMLNTTIDIVFLIFSVGIGVMGAFQLVPAIIHFIQASNSQNGEQRKEAGSGIGTSIMILLLAGLVFMLKAPIKTLVGLGS
jgi:ABC-type phosphate transport system permease subunit